MLHPGTDGRLPADLRHASATSAKWLNGAASRDPAVLGSAIDEARNIEQSGLDMGVHAMMRLAALVAAGESGTTYLEQIATALDHGVTLLSLIHI